MQQLNKKTGRKPSVTENEREIDATHFGVFPSQDSTPALRHLLKACRTMGARRIVLAPGTYHFHPQYAEERYCAISNNDNGLKRSPFALMGWDGLEIDGQGSEFIFHGFLIPFLIENCREIVLKNFSIDWAQPFYFQAEVCAVTPARESFEIQVHPECKTFVKNDEVFFGSAGAPAKPRRLSLDAVNWVQNLFPNYVFEGAQKHIATAYRDLAFLSPDLVRRGYFKAEDLGEGRFRLTSAVERLPKPGDLIVATGNLFPNRHSPAIRILESQNLTIQDVSVHHAGAMGLIAERSENITLERFDVCLREDSRRIVTTVADATHFVYCRGMIRLKDCLFENMLDDATNIHGCYVRVDGVNGSHGVVARIMHHQQFGFPFVRPGERLRFSRLADLTPYGEAEVEAVEFINEELFQITFAKSVAGVLGQDTILDNVSWQPDVEITGCTVRNNRARSLLLSTGGKVEISNNTFLHSSMSNILMEGDCEYWHESGPSMATVIRDNRFVGLSKTHPAIHISPKGLIPWPEAYHQNILIENNTFETQSGALLYARSAEDVTFRGNRVAWDVPEMSVPPPAAFDLDFCRNIRVEGNMAEDFKNLRIACGSQTSDIVAETGTMS